MKTSEKPPKKITRPGVSHRDTNGEAIEETLEYNAPDYLKDVYAFGAPISTNFARELIQNYWRKLSKKRDKDKNIAFTFGKEALLSIVSQNNCVGIRFYFADKENGSIIDPTTLVAIGVDSNNFDIGTSGDYIVRDLEPGEKIKGGKSVNEIENGQIREMVPPIRLGEFIKDDKDIDPHYQILAGIIKNYFENK